MNQLTPYQTRSLKKLVSEACSALESEMEAVREHPSTDVLQKGKKIKNKSSDEIHYRFETRNHSLRFAEKCIAYTPTGTYTIYPVEILEDAIVFRFPEDIGETIPETDLEWENDYILKCIYSRLQIISDEAVPEERIRRMLSPRAKESTISTDERPFSSPPIQTFDKKENYKKGTQARPDSKDISPRQAFQRKKRPIAVDEFHNRAQIEAIEKAMTEPVTYIWGPPGTGKTATIGFIMANYLLQGKSTLFVSNTNRAVDHGMLCLLDALDRLGKRPPKERITRFGERILDNKRLNEIHFEQQMEKLSGEKKQKAADLQHWLDARELPDLKPHQKSHIERKIEQLGGVEAIEEKINHFIQSEGDSFFQLRRFKTIGTTLAKVCTSDLLESMEFDVVVIDEASMAHIPYMLIMASRAKKHLVVAGDPMQLPPISITQNVPARLFLEQDIFVTVSGAKSTTELFHWHDRNPSFTSFFNIQYRMQSDLAKVISDVFYEGRLLTAQNDGTETREPQNATAGYTNKKNEAVFGVAGLFAKNSVKSSSSSSALDSYPDVIESEEPQVEKQQHHKHSVTLIDSSPLRPSIHQDRSKRGFRPVNEVHTRLLQDLTRQILQERRCQLTEVGIIVPFRSVVWHLRQELCSKNKWYDLEIGTIHTFQGREKKVIILDTVMAGESRNGRVEHYSVRPFDEAKNGLSVHRLLNVAFSRGKEHLFVMADMQHIHRIYQKKFLGRLLDKLPLHRA